MLGEMVRIIETPCENTDCSCCKEPRNRKEGNRKEENANNTLVESNTDITKDC